MDPGLDSGDTTWNELGQSAPLAAFDVHVWRAELDLDDPALACAYTLLDQDELNRARRFLRAEHGRHFTACRAMLRCQLARYLAVAPSAIEFEYNAHGKPSLLPNHRWNGLEFNVSHSHGAALFAFTRIGPVGVDIEAVSEVRECEKIARRYFSPREVVELFSLPESDRVLAFFQCWTRKEAYIKARGKGLSIGLDSFDVSLGTGKPAALLRSEGDPRAVDRWRLTNIEPGDGFVGALALENRAHTVRLGAFRPETVFDCITSV